LYKFNTVTYGVPLIRIVWDKPQWTDEKWVKMS
jgi:hypothetical protein